MIRDVLQPPPPRIAVVGAGHASDEQVDLAYRLGRALAERGAVVVCGGLGGVMEAAARGCREAGGLVLGLLSGGDPGEASPWVNLPVPTGMGEGRNVLVARVGEAMVSVGGAWGTLSEIALARKMGRPVTTLVPPSVDGLDLAEARDPEEAAEWAVARALESRGED